MSPAPDTAHPLLRARDLGRRDPDRPARWLYRGLSVDVRPGEILGLRGPTGSGKTLLLRALAGLDPVDEGEVELLGRGRGAWNPTAWRRTAVYLHQAPALFPGTVEDNLREPFGFSAHAGRRFPADRALGHLRRLGRGRAFLDQPVEDLSGGERQLTALVRAVLLEPRVLLLDEPTAALDPAATDEVEETVRRWLEEDEASRGALWVTHDAEQAGRVAHRQRELRGGRLRPAGDGRAAAGGTDGPAADGGAAGDGAGGGRGEAAGTGGGGPAGTPGADRP